MKYHLIYHNYFCYICTLFGKRDLLTLRAFIAAMYEIYFFLEKNEDMSNKMFLYEDDNPMIVPLEGQFIQISSQEDGTQTVLEAGEQKIMLDGRFMKVYYPVQSSD